MCQCHIFQPYFVWIYQEVCEAGAWHEEAKYLSSPPIPPGPRLKGHYYAHFFGASGRTLLMDGDMECDVNKVLSHKIE